MNAKLKILCELYDKSDENIDIDALLKVCFFKDLKDVLKLLSRKQCVKFSYMCLKSTIPFKNIEGRMKLGGYFDVAERWLENPDSVSDDELIRAGVHSAYCRRKSDYSNIASCSFGSSISMAINKQKQKYKNFGLLIEIIKDE